MQSIEQKRELNARDFRLTDSISSSTFSIMCACCCM